MERQQQPLPPLRRTSRWMLSESGCIDRSGIGPVPDNWSYFNIPCLAHEASFVFTRGGLGLEFILIGPQISNQPTLKSKYRVACGETPFFFYWRTTASQATTVFEVPYDSYTVENDEVKYWIMQTCNAFIYWREHSFLLGYDWTQMRHSLT